MLESHERVVGEQGKQRRSCNTIVDEGSRRRLPHTPCPCHRHLHALDRWHSKWIRVSFRLNHSFCWLPVQSPAHSTIEQCRILGVLRTQTENVQTEVAYEIIPSAINVMGFVPVECNFSDNNWDCTRRTATMPLHFVKDVPQPSAPLLHEHSAIVFLVNDKHQWHFKIVCVCSNC